jgi:anti-sigma28 factor (negative regulator of flagellin synthesis)
MRINENGFTEKVATPSTPPPAAGKVVSTTSTETSPVTTGSGDNLQLSGFAARLNSGLETDTATRAANVSRIAASVNAGAFQIDTAAVSSSIVTEGLQSRR